MILPDNETVRTHGALLLAALALILTVTLVAVRIQEHTDGKLPCLLDDAYIHLALAKNLARDGRFALPNWDFSSSSSSPLYTLTIAGIFRLLGTPDEAWALGLNLAAALALLALLDLAFRDRSALFRIALLAAAILAIPLPFLVLTGMEHVLQMLLVVAFLHAAVPRRENAPGSAAITVALAFLVAAIRFEGAAVVAVVSAILWFRNGWRPAAAVAVAGIAPLALYAAVSLAHGWDPLPNSVLIKGFLRHTGGGRSALDLAIAGATQWAHNAHLLGLGALMLGLYIVSAPGPRDGHDRPADGSGVMVAAVFALTMTHVFLAWTGWFYQAPLFIRYDAYLVALHLYAIARLLASRPVPSPSGARRAAAAVALVALLIMPAFIRGARSFGLAVEAGRDFYLQHYQVARFLAGRYDGRTIACHDIGIVNFMASPRCIDLMGLAHPEVGRALIAERVDAPFLEGLLRRESAEIAVLCPNLFRREIAEIPDSWIEAGRIRNPANRFFHDDTVAFYALTPESLPALSRELDAFLPFLPPGVTTDRPPDGAGR